MSEEVPATRVFVSYARKNLPFVEQLVTRLSSVGFEIAYDLSEIDHNDPDSLLAPDGEWWGQIKAMIASSDVFLFVVTPDSGASTICCDEIEHALALGKRVISILRETVDFNRVSERVRSLSIVLDFVESGHIAFDLQFEKLVKELRRDLAWLRRMTRLSRAASLWDAEGRPEAQLPRAGSILEFETWSARRPAGAPAPGSIVQSFLDAARGKEAEDRNVLVTTIGRAFVKPAEEAMRLGRPMDALRLSAAGTILGDDIDHRLVPERISAIRQAAWRNQCFAVLQGHSDKVKMASFNRAGTMIATASWDATARLWDAVTAEPLFVLEGHEGRLWSAEFDRRGERLLTAAEDHTARVWNCFDGRCSAVLCGHGGILRAARFSPDGHLVVTASDDRTAIVWDADGGEVIATLEGHQGGVRDVCFSPDGRYVATASADGYAVIRDVANFEVALVIEAPPSSSGAGRIIWSLAFDPESNSAVIGGSDGCARIWSIDKQAEIAALCGGESFVSRVVVSSQGTVGAASWDGNARLRHSDGEELLLSGHSGYVHAIAFDPQGSRAATAANDSTVRIWRLSDGQCLTTLHGHDAPVTDCAFSPNGKFVVSSSDDASAIVWHVSNRLITAGMVLEGSVTGLAISPDGDRFISKAFGKLMADPPSPAVPVLGRTADLTPIASLEGHDGGISDVQFSANGELVLTASYKDGVTVWDAHNGRKISSFHAGGVCSARFGRDGKTVLSAGMDQRVAIWDASTGKLLRACLGHQDEVSLAIFSHGGETIGSISDDKTARLWDYDGSAEIVRMNHDARLTSLAFAPDDRLVATGCIDGYVRILDIESRELVGTLESFCTTWQGAEFSPGQRQIMTKGTRVRVWSIDDFSLLFELATASDVISAQYDPLGRYIYCSVDDGIYFFDAASGELVGQLDPQDGYGRLSIPRLSLDGSTLFTMADSRIMSWHVEDLTTFCGNVTALMSASLVRGRGMRSQRERSDLLMQSAPDDLARALLDRMSDDQRSEFVIASQRLGNWRT